nr:reverse transcriptase domain-containing protein [Tanacetum cinerariifolium]
MEKYYNFKVQSASFKPRELVYRNNDASRVKDTGKLGPKWKGPYEVTKALGKGAYKLRDHDGKQLMYSGMTVCGLFVTIICALADTPRMNDLQPDIEQLKVPVHRSEDQMIKVVNDQFAKLDSNLTEMACHLEEKFYPRLLNTISGRMWLLTHGLKLFLVKCLNSSEYLTALKTAISRAIEKGMQSGLTAGVDHGREGMSLADLKVPVHRSEDQMVHGETSLSFSLSVSHSRVERIRENISIQWSALVGFWTPLSEPLYVTSLMGVASTSSVVPVVSVTTTALPTTFASGSSIPPISTDDYEIVCVDGQEGAGTNGRVVADENVVPFPNVDDVELNNPQ